MTKMKVVRKPKREGYNAGKTKRTRSKRRKS